MICEYNVARGKDRWIGYLYRVESAKEVALGPTPRGLDVCKVKSSKEV